MKRARFFFVGGILLFLVVQACRQATEPAPRLGILAGSIKSGEKPLKGYLFWGDSLLVTTGADGVFSIGKVEPGEYLLTASALNYADTSQVVLVTAGKTTRVVFDLRSDARRGKVFGEFQDAVLFFQNASTDSSLLTWSEKQVFDGGTGATLQAKTFGHAIPDRFVLLGDSVLTMADAWGQFVLTLPWGTYPLTGTCQGYRSRTRTVTVPPNGRVYLNFFLWRE